ncbi:MAG: hypothetical protein V4637_09580 [Pseudomonadota bacterium]
MKQTMIAKALGAAFLSTTFAMSAVAGQAGDVNRSGAYESGDRGVTTPASPGTVPAQRAPKAAAGDSVMPSLNQPANVSESAPQRTGKEPVAGKVADDKRMANPKTPASPNESGPSAMTKDGASTPTSRETNRGATSGTVSDERSTGVTTKTPTSPNETGPVRDKLK